MFKDSRRHFLRYAAYSVGQSLLLIYDVALAVGAKFGLRTETTAPRQTAATNPASTHDPVPQQAPTLHNPDLLGTELLTRPTVRSVTVNMVPAKTMEAFFEYGVSAGLYTAQTQPTMASTGVVLKAVLEPLIPNTRYYYRLRFRTDRGGFSAGPEHSFLTQRERGASFTFAIRANSHFDAPNHNNPACCAGTVQSETQEKPDFYIDLGDACRTATLQESAHAAVTKHYLNQRPFLGQIARSAPLFWVNSHHEVEQGWQLDDSPTGLAEDYYAWEWGDALFMVIDPYRRRLTDPGGVSHAQPDERAGKRAAWCWTLGDAQYQWFKAILAQSTARYKFVFHHHSHDACHDGVEWVDADEWGGKAHGRTDAFRQHRPTGELPIHALMVKFGVTLFLQGHDHCFARQERDGIIYQTIPVGGAPGCHTDNRAVYPVGEQRLAIGHLRVHVSHNRVTVNYIRASLPQDDQPDRCNGQVDYAYHIYPY